MAYPENVLVGDRVRYESAAGTIRGEVIMIKPGLNAAGDVINWIYVEYQDGINDGRTLVTRLPETGLAMFKFKVIFRDGANTKFLEENA